MLTGVFAADGYGTGPTLNTLDNYPSSNRYDSQNLPAERYGGQNQPMERYGSQCSEV